MRIEDPARIRGLIEVVDGVDHHEMVTILARTGALLEGHFELTSGRHSAIFLRFGQVGWDRAVAERLARLLASRLDLRTARPQVVLCPSTAGLLLGHAVARHLDLELAVVGMDLDRRPTTEIVDGGIERGAMVLVVNDVITTGGTLRTLRDAVARQGGSCSGALAFAALHSSGPMGWPIQPAKFLLRGAWPTHEPGADCPGCRGALEILPAAELN